MTLSCTFLDLFLALIAQSIDYFVLVGMSKVSSKSLIFVHYVTQLTIVGIFFIKFVEILDVFGLFVLHDVREYIFETLY